MVQSIQCIASIRNSGQPEETGDDDDLDQKHSNVGARDLTRRRTSGRSFGDALMSSIESRPFRCACFPRITRSSVCKYGWTSLAFLLIGFLLILLVRWQLAWRMGSMLPEFYNQLGAMHGTIMVFLAVVPLAVAASATIWCR